jgi:hypothetical protein
LNHLQNDPLPKIAYCPVDKRVVVVDCDVLITRIFVAFFYDLETGTGALQNVSPVIDGFILVTVLSVARTYSVTKLTPFKIPIVVLIA